MANVALSLYPTLAHSFIPSTNVCGALSTHLALGPALGSQGWGGYRMDVVPMPMEGKGFQGRRNSIGRGWGLASGNTESEVRKEPQAELSVFFLGPVLDPHWSSSLMAPSRLPVAAWFQAELCPLYTRVCCGPAGCEDCKGLCRGLCGSLGSLVLP